MLVFAVIVILSQLGPNWGTESPSASPNTYCYLNCLSNGLCITETRVCDEDNTCGNSEIQRCRAYASFARLLNIAAPEEAETDLTTSEIPVVSPAFRSLDVMLASLPFAHHLSNPCDWKGTPNYIPPANKTEFLEEFYGLLCAGSKFHLVEAALHRVGNCTNVGIDNLPLTPTLQALQGMNATVALNKIHLSLLMHTAYLFLTNHQFTTDLKCHDNVEGGVSLSTLSFRLAHRLRDMACYIRVGMRVLGYELDDVSPLLNTTVTEVSVCSRRYFRDCQVLKSTRYILQTVSQYGSNNYPGNCTPEAVQTEV